MNRRRRISSWWIAVALLCLGPAVAGAFLPSVPVVPSPGAVATDGAAGEGIAAAEGEERTGGDTTVFDDGPNAYGRTLANLDPRRWSEIQSGKRLFVRQWPERGPWADAASCSDCHFRDGRGPRPDPAHSALALLLRLGRPAGGADPRYGAQLRRLGHGVPAPGQFTVHWQEVAGLYPSGEPYTLRHPTPRVGQLAHGPLDPSTRLSLRVPPAVFGLGLIEAIPAHAILAHADPEDVDGNGISGTPGRVRDSSTGHLVLGRFGWKASQASLADQSVTALRQDLGATATTSEVTTLVRYLTALAVPGRRRWTEPVVREGEALFAEIGCGGCHRPDIRTGQVQGWPELSGQAIRPYTDLLLHDMGSRLADGVAEGSASGSEWRTPPLWGLGLLPVVNGEMRLLHDGRARSPEEAILWHGGEAATARDRFVALPRAKREALTIFLATL